MPRGTEKVQTAAGPSAPAATENSQGWAQPPAPAHLQVIAACQQLVVGQAGHIGAGAQRGGGGASHAFCVAHLHGPVWE